MEFVNKFRAKNTKATQAQSKLKQIERMEKVEAPVQDDRKIQFRFPQPQRSGLKAITLSNIHHAYGDLKVYQGIDFEAQRGQRIVLVGPNPAVPADLYDTPQNFVVPDNFGPGGDIVATSGTGEPVGIRSTPDTGGAQLVVPEGYVSGNQISGTAVYENASFAVLGIVVGNYAWTWGSGPDADSFRLEVRETVPNEQLTWGKIKALFQ